MSSLILPKFVALKGDNGKYLKRFYTEGVQYLQFSADYISDPLAALELFPTADGNFRIKNIDDGRFWRLGTNNWINPDSDGSSGNDSPILLGPMKIDNSSTLFCPMKIDDNTMALLSIGNIKICKRYTAEGMTSSLNALADSVDSTAKLTVEEPVLARTIYDIRYDTDKAKIYDETSLVLGQDSASNDTDQPKSVTVRMIYNATKIATWKDSFSLKSCTVTATTEAAIPVFLDGKVVVSNEVQTEIEWGKTFTNNTTQKVETRVPVPPKTRAEVTLITTWATCDVPFTYTQEDTLFSGSTFINDYHGTFTGSNGYGTQINIKFEPL